MQIVYIYLILVKYYYLCGMKKEKQIIALELLKTGRYNVVGSEVFNKHGKSLFNYPLPSGYIQCTLFNGKRYEGKLKTIIYKHALIYLANFGEFDSSLVIAHKDCNNKNNLPSNLVAVTQSENKRMSKSTRTHIVLNRLNPKQINKIHELNKSGLNQSEIARQLSINRTVVMYHIKKTTITNDIDIIKYIKDLINAVD